MKFLTHIYTHTHTVIILFHGHLYVNNVIGISYVSFIKNEQEHFLNAKGNVSYKNYELMTN